MPILGETELDVRMQALKRGFWLKISDFLAEVAWSYTLDLERQPPALHYVIPISSKPLQEKEILERAVLSL